MKHGEVFQGNNAEKLSMLRDFRTKKVDPNHTVLTSNKDSLGQTYFEKAYPLFAFAPDFLDDFQQMVGRANRQDSSAIIEGAIFTEERISNFEDYKLSVAGK